MNFKQLSLALLCGLAMLIAEPASAAVVLTDNFDAYPDGDLPGNGGWVNHSGGAPEVMVSSGAAVIDNGSGSGDSNSALSGTFTSGILTASFDMTVTNPTGGMTGTDFEYFAHFYPSDDGFNFRSRTDIQVPNAAGPGADYTIGIATQGSASEVTLPIDFAFGTVVPVTITYDLTGGTSSLTAGGQTVNTLVISTGQSIDAFAFRQSGSSSDELITIDNLVVTHIPEPATLGLMLIGLIGVATARRS